MTCPRISLVIPAYNEEMLLPRLLGTVTAARLRYEGPGRLVEVIVADNASTDATAQVAAEHGCRVVSSPVRNIGATRNAGARAARGELLAFVDADSQIHSETFSVIDEVLRSERVVAGASGATMERWSAGITLMYAMLLPVVWITGCDTGVVFCRRSDFEEVGGYDERRRVAEDVVFLLRLRRLGKRRGQRMKRATRIKAVASTRKFDQFGDWHYLRFFWHGGAYLLGRATLEEMEDRYWYKPGR